MYFISYYLERGYKTEYLLNLSRYDKIIMSASMLYWSEKRIEEMQALYGVK